MVLSEATHSLKPDIAMLIEPMTEEETTTNTEADFLSVYHLICSGNRPETFHDTIKASFELHCGI